MSSGASEKHKIPRSFRLEKGTLEGIARLSDRWSVSQAQVIELLVREAEREGRELRVVPTRGEEVS